MAAFSSLPEALSERASPSHKAALDLSCSSSCFQMMTESACSPMILSARARIILGPEAKYCRASDAISGPAGKVVGKFMSNSMARPSPSAKSINNSANMRALACVGSTLSRARKASMATPAFPKSVATMARPLAALTY